MYYVTGPELDRIASISNSVNLAFFTLTCGAMLGLLGTVLTAAPGADLGVVVMLLLAAAVLTVYFGIWALLDYRAARRNIDEIKQAARS